MTIKEAKHIIYAEPNAPFDHIAIATFTLASKHKTRQVKYADLLECMRRGRIPGKITVAAEAAAWALYRRTGRKRKSTVPYKDFDTSPESWERYLRRHKIKDE